MTKQPTNLDFKVLWLDKDYNRGPLLILEISRYIFGIIILAIWVDRLFSALIAILIAVPVIFVVMRLFSKRIQRFYHRLELRFLSNLNARERAEADKTSGTEKILSKHFNPQSGLSAWDAHLINLEVNPQAAYVGKNLQELGWREQYGINIAYIKRGDKLIYAPGKNNKLLPYDYVGIIATDEQMQVFKPVFDAVENLETASPRVEDITVQKIVVDEHNQLKGQTVLSSGIRERTNGLVVGIERNQERILNPTSSTVFEWGDIVWIVGERKKIRKLNKIV